MREGSRAGMVSAAIVLPALWLAAAMLIASPAAADTAVRFQIVFDGSGSMWGRIRGSPDAKFTLAREGLRQILPALDRTAEVGLVLFGHRRRGDCSDVEQALSVQPLDPGRILEPLESLNPKGRGPLTLAMAAAADVLPAGEGKESLVLIHDDYDNCQGDPCQIASELHRVRPALAVHVVSIGTKPQDAERMACVPRITGGRHFVAREAADVAPAVGEAVRLASIALPGDSITVPRPREVSREEIGPPGLRLSAALTKNGEAVADAVTWRVFPAGDAPAPPVAETTEPGPRLSLPPGEYVVEAHRDAVSVRRPVTVSEGRPTRMRITLNAGVLRLAAPAFAEADAAVPSTAVISLIAQGDGAQRSGDVVWMGSADERELYVPAGTYRVVLQDGQFRAERTIVVPSGSTGTPPLATAAGRIRLQARDDGLSERPSEGVLFRVLEDDPTAPGGRREIARSASATPQFVLPAGTYHVVARKGAAEARELIALGAGDDVSRTLDLKLARLSVSVQLPGDAAPEVEKVTWRVYRLGGDPETVVARSIQLSPQLLLPEGRYRVEARLGRLNALASREVHLAEAGSQEVVLEANAARLQLRLVRGGLALGKDVFWEVRDSSGDVVWRIMEPEPQAYLAAGRYTVRAETRERQLEQTVDLGPGEARTVAVALE